jgi:hypothetical protein
MLRPPSVYAMPYLGSRARLCELAECYGAPERAKVPQVRR